MQRSEFAPQVDLAVAYQVDEFGQEAAYRGGAAARLASIAPKTATARAPPTCRLVLNTPLALPARCPGTLFSRTAVTGGITRGPANPTRTISMASAHLPRHMQRQPPVGVD